MVLECHDANSIRDTEVNKMAWKLPSELDQEELYGLSNAHITSNFQSSVTPSRIPPLGVQT